MNTDVTKNALIITWEGFQDHELIYPYYRLLEAGFHVDIMANKLGRIHGIYGCNMPCTKLVSELSDEEKYKNFLNNYSMVVLPGGVKSLEKLRQEVKVLDFIKESNDLGKTISSTCHGAQLMISSKIVKGKKISGYYSIKDDINNSGAEYVNAPAVVDDNIISSPHYDFMGDWMKNTLEVHFKK